MNKELTKTYWAKIFLGTRVGYTDEIIPYDTVEGMVRDYIDSHPCCVTITRTKFTYYKGEEEGVEIGLINYPRFDKKPKEIREYAIGLADHLKESCNQERVSVMFPDNTIMLDY